MNFNMHKLKVNTSQVAKFTSDYVRDDTGQVLAINCSKNNKRKSKGGLGKASKKAEINKKVVKAKKDNTKFGDLVIIMK